MTTLTNTDKHCSKRCNVLKYQLINTYPKTNLHLMQASVFPNRYSHNCRRGAHSEPQCNKRNIQSLHWIMLPRRVTWIRLAWYAHDLAAVCSPRARLSSVFPAFAIVIEYEYVICNSGKHHCWRTQSIDFCIMYSYLFFIKKNSSRNRRQTRVNMCII